MDMFVNEWKLLEHTIGWKIILSDFPRWESIMIEEQDDKNMTVQSKIEIPTQICISVQCWLFDVITSLGKIVPHTMPKNIHSQIIIELVHRLSIRYQTLSNDTFTKSNQKASWQFFFDVKVLILLFVSRENKHMKEKLLGIANTFKSFIDPFDFDVFYQHVNINVKRNAAFLQQGMGCLIPNMEFLGSTMGSVNLTNTHERDPNILEMSSADANTEWFALLPVIVMREIDAAPPQELTKRVRLMKLEFFLKAWILEKT